MRAISFAALAHIVGWVKRDVGTIYVWFAYFNVPQQSEIASKLANPTRSVADHRLNPTYDLSFRPIKWIPPFWIRSDEADAFLVNTHPKCSPGTRMQPLAQTWHVKMW